MIKNKLLKLSRRIFEPLGLALTNGNHFTDDAALKRCKENGVQINTVIDVGASDGRWSDLCMEHYPNAHYLLVEAQMEHEEALIGFKKNRDKVDYVICAAGDKDGVIYFNNDSLLSGSASNEFVEGKTVEVPMFKISSLIEKFGLKGPYLIKLDTHGFEIPIIEGLLDNIEDIELFIIEAYNFRISDKALKFFELCDYMDKLGFSPIDIVGLMSRKYDNVLWQMDIFFCSQKREVFDYKNFE